MSCDSAVVYGSYVWVRGGGGTTSPVLEWQTLVGRFSAAHTQSRWKTIIRFDIFSTLGFHSNGIKL